ncbi:Tumour necrosis factor receptor superfamily member 19 [Gracilibacillus ureilyticus]|uniref:Tumour necrosis factor receptor superfamily member 19 n=1 Tax=Gracilibacillus ureilyticus TaxID=531814 RepID=A0A1H9NKT6_9BACI|nr:YtzI protein [Gracilibacillus ureilyticus]SER36624.1 Tumour necrosis factor receptor superfamily member 19 [Gracilibacillus ureilyticus]
MWVVIVVCIAIVIAVLALSIMTLNKGYGYKQTVDPLPEDIINKTEEEKTRDE